MNDFEEIINNASYKDFFNKEAAFRKDQFINPPSDEYQKLDNNGLTKVIGFGLQKRDKDSNALYGIEIKCNGSSRSGRIPLLRVSENSASIWKVASKVEDLEKAVVALEELYYFLENHNEISYRLPFKVVVLRDSETRYASPMSPDYNFVNKLVKESKIVLLSFELLKRLFSEDIAIDVDSYIKVGKFCSIDYK